MSDKKVCAYQSCNKKLKKVDQIMGKCRCENIYCSQHRLPESHMCTIVYKIDKDKFMEDNKCSAVKLKVI